MIRASVECSKRSPRSRAQRDADTHRSSEVGQVSMYPRAGKQNRRSNNSTGSVMTPLSTLAGVGGSVVFRLGRDSVLCSRASARATSSSSCLAIVRNSGKLAHGLCAARSRPFRQSVDAGFVGWRCHGRKIGVTIASNFRGWHSVRCSAHGRGGMDPSLCLVSRPSVGPSAAASAARRTRAQVVGILHSLASWGSAWNPS